MKKFNIPVLKSIFNIDGKSLIPHRSPFLFVDKLISADETGAVGEYTFTQEKNDFFKGHFDGNPIVPGVILIEAMTQVAGCGAMARSMASKDIKFYMIGIEKTKFRLPFKPGDKLTTVVSITREIPPLCSYKLMGFRNEECGDRGEPAVEAEVKCFVGEMKEMI